MVLNVINKLLIVIFLDFFCFASKKYLKILMDMYVGRFRRWFYERQYLGRDEKDSTEDGFNV